MPQTRTYRRIAAVLALVCACLLPSFAAGAQPTNDRLITADGAGDAVLGLTPDELAASLGPEYDLGDEVRITVDFDGRVVTSDGTVQFRAAMTDVGDELTLFIVSNPEYTTAEGVGPTTTIADAEAVYGQATLSWNPDNEGREFVSFANGPQGRIAFRTPGIGGTNVGIYPDGELTTTDYEDGSAIAAVWVSCIPGADCPADRAAAQATAEPTATPEAVAEPTATPEATTEPTATPEAVAEPTATQEPTPTPEPVATPEPTPDDGTAGEQGALPTTGSTELLLFSMVSVLFVIGGAFVLVERRFLAPEWLKVRD